MQRVRMAGQDSALAARRSWVQPDVVAAAVAELDGGSPYPEQDTYPEVAEQCGGRSRMQPAERNCGNADVGISPLGQHHGPDRAERQPEVSLVGSETERGGREHIPEQPPCVLVLAPGGKPFRQAHVIGGRAA